MYLELSQKYLIKARATSGATRQYFANLCQVCLAKGSVKPEDIGATQEELVNLQTRAGKGLTGKIEVKKKQNDQISLCQKYLEQCRQAQGASRQYYANLCFTSLTKYGISFSDIGTTSIELSELQKKGFLESATNYLTEARNARGAKRKCYADLCWEYLSKAKATPKEIGSSEEELQMMSI